MATFKMSAIAADQLVATDLRTAVNGASSVEVYRIELEMFAEAAEAVFFVNENRIGVAWGADADWGDAKDAESGVAAWIRGELQG